MGGGEEDWETSPCRHGMAMALRTQEAAIASMGSVEFSGLEHLVLDGAGAHSSPCSGEQRSEQAVKRGTHCFS